MVIWGMVYRIVLPTLLKYDNGKPTNYRLLSQQVGISHALPDMTEVPCVFRGKLHHFPSFIWGLTIVPSLHKSQNQIMAKKQCNTLHNLI
jgi:hypothetical protein